MRLRDDLFSLTMQERLTYDPDENLFFVNFEGLRIRSSEQIRELERTLPRSSRRWGKRSAPS
jgi:propionate CoA-transferase